MIGQVLGDRYRIRGQIGEGGMASVYTAVDDRLDRRVAVKILHSKLATDPELRNRFLLEAKTLSGFDHPNIVRIYDYSGDHCEQLWLVTEILRGHNLAQFVKREANRRLHPVVACLIISEVCSALSYAHNKGIHHRDIKPENIFMLQDGRVKLMDFGIAKDINRSNITMTGTFMGSPSYMPPEQIRGAATDERSDLYSLCITFYEILTGKLPYSGQNPSEVINKIMQGGAVSPVELVPRLNLDLSALIMRGIAKDAEARFVSIAQFASKIRSLLDNWGFSGADQELISLVSDRSAFERRLRQVDSHGRSGNPQTANPEPKHHKPTPIGQIPPRYQKHQRGPEAPKSNVVNLKHQQRRASRRPPRPAKSPESMVEQFKSLTQKNPVRVRRIKVRPPVKRYPQPNAKQAVARGAMQPRRRYQPTKSVWPHYLLASVVSLSFLILAFWGFLWLFNLMDSQAHETGPPSTTPKGVRGGEP